MDDAEESPLTLCSAEFPFQYFVLLCCHLLLTLRKNKHEGKVRRAATSLSDIYVLNLRLWIIFTFTVDNRCGEHAVL